MKKHLFVALLTMIPAGPAFAQESAKVETASAPPSKLKVVSLRPGDTGYSLDAASRGIQGVVELLVAVGEDGKPTQIEVKESSRSSELDQGAVELVKQSKIGTKAAVFVVPVEFLRDSVTTLPKKTCSELNVDAAYYKATFPERDVGNMPVLNMTVGAAFMYGLPGIPREKLSAFAGKLRKAANQVVEACEKEPNGNYFEVFAKLLKRADG